MEQRRVPPSRRRYEVANPMVSARVPRDVYDRLQEVVKESGKSIADFIREALEVQERNVGEAWDKGWDAGNKLSEGKYRVTFHCAICGAPIEVTSPEAKQAAGQYLREHGWAHQPCHERKRQETQRSQQTVSPPRK